MVQMLNPASIAAPASTYSHGVLIPAGYDVLLTSGTLGIAPDGALAGDFEGQCRLAWSNIKAILQEGGFALEDIVKVNAFLINRNDRGTFRTVRDEHISHQPASTVVCADLLDSAWLLELEVIAARAAKG